MSVIEIKNDNFEKEVLKSDKPVLIDFNADWCGPCRMLRPVIDELSEERSEYKFVSINIDKEEDLAEQYNVSSIPCLVIIKDGEEVSRSIGFKPKDELESFLRGN